MYLLILKLKYILSGKRIQKERPKNINDDYLQVMELWITLNFFFIPFHVSQTFHNRNYHSYNQGLLIYNSTVNHRLDIAYNSIIEMHDLFLRCFWNSSKNDRYHDK